MYEKLVTLIGLCNHQMVARMFTVMRIYKFRKNETEKIEEMKEIYRTQEYRQFFFLLFFRYLCIYFVWYETHSRHPAIRRSLFCCCWNFQRVYLLKRFTLKLLPTLCAIQYTYLVTLDSWFYMLYPALKE